jgi:AcrR family transcriptional regulator
MPGALPAYRQRDALIRAALELAEKLPPARITAQALARHAGLATRSLTQQFGGMEGFAKTLQQHHYDQARQHALAVIQGQTPGLERLLRATEAYSDFSFARRGLRAWLSEQRMNSPEMQAQWRTDSQVYAQFIASELALCGWPHPLAGARLFIAAVIELVRHEQHVGHKSPAARRALERFLHTHDRTGLA